MRTSVKNLITLTFLILFYSHAQGAVIQDNAISTDEDKVLRFSLSSYARVGSEDQMELSPVNNGTVNYDRSSGQIVYTPDPDYCNASDDRDTFTYTYSETDSFPPIIEVDNFHVWVECENDPPTVNPISTVVINESGDKNIQITVGDIEGDTITVTATSSRTELVPNSPANILVTGSGNSRNLYIKPIAGQSGNTQITVKADDNNGGEAFEYFTFTVNEVNSTASISGVTTQNFTTGEFAEVSVTLSDSDTASSALRIEGSSTAPSLLPSSRITSNGTGWTRTVKIDPIEGQTGATDVTLKVYEGSVYQTETAFRVVVGSAPNNTANLDVQEDGTLYVTTTSHGLSGYSTNDTFTYNGVNGAVSHSAGKVRYKPNTNYCGPDSFIVTHLDEPDEAHLGGAVKERLQVNVTVNCENDLPTLSHKSGSLSFDEEGSTTIELSTTDVEDQNDQLSVRVIGNTNPTLIPNASISITQSSGNQAWRDVSVESAPDEHGSAKITFETKDLDGDTKTLALTFNVAEENDPPYFYSLGNINTTEDTEGDEAFEVRDKDTDAGLLIVRILSSSNTDLLPNNASHIWIEEINDNARKLHVNPVADEHGDSTVKIEVYDRETRVTKDVTVRVASANDPAQINNLADFSVDKNSSATEAFTITDVDGAITSTSHSVIAESQDTTIVPNNVSNLTINGTGENRELFVKPLSGKTGDVDIVVKVDDGGTNGYVEQTIRVSIEETNVTPSVTPSHTSVNVFEGEQPQITLTLTDSDTALDDLILSASSNLTSLLAEPSSYDFGGTGGTRTLTFKPLANQTGTATVTITVKDAETGGHSNTATVTLQVKPTNGLSDTMEAIEDEDGEFSLVNYFAESVNASDAVSQDPVNGSVHYDFDQRKLVYTPDAQYCGPDYFEFQHSNLDPDQDEQFTGGPVITVLQMSVNVTCVNDVPRFTALADAEVFAGQTLHIPLNITEVDVADNPDDATVVLGADNPSLLGTFEVQGTGSDRTLVIQALSNLSGMTSIDVQVNDTELGPTKSFNLTIAPTPVLSDTLVIDEDQVSHIDPLALGLHAFDATSVIGTPLYGAAEYGLHDTTNQPGVLYTPLEHSCESDAFTVTHSVSVLGTPSVPGGPFVTGGYDEVLTVNVDVNCINDLPIINDGEDAQLSTGVNTAQQIVLTAVDADHDAAALQWGVDTVLSTGTVAIVGDATGESVTFEYTPAVDFVGADEFFVNVTDGVVETPIQLKVIVDVQDNIPSPIVNYESGTYPYAIDVEIDANGATAVHYSLDGSDVSTDSPLYTGSIRVESDVTLNVKGFNDEGLQSQQTSYLYTIDSDAEVDLNTLTPVNYGAEGSGNATISEDGSTLTLQGDVSQAIPYDYTVTANTVLQFDFSSTEEGELHGIGFDTQTASVTKSQAFQLFGVETCTSCVRHYRDYYIGANTRRYEIPVGNFYQGSFSQLFFMLEESRAGKTTVNGTFSNIRVFESAELPTLTVFDDNANFQVTGNWGSSVSSSLAWNNSYTPSLSEDAAFTRKLNELSERGEYELYMWWPYNVGQSANLPIEIVHNFGVVDVVADQSDVSSQSRWNYLGNYHFDPANNNLVSWLSSEADMAAADAIRLIKVGDATSAWVDISFPGSTSDTVAAEGQPFDITVTPKAGFEANVTNVDVSLDPYGLDWRVAEFADGAYHYSFSDLTVGDYVLTVSVSGSQTYRFKVSVVQAAEAIDGNHGYYFINPNWVGKTASIAAIHDGTEVSINGTTFTLKAGEIRTETISSQGQTLVSTKGVTVQAAASGLDMPVHLSQMGTEFVIPHSRNEHHYHLFSPEQDAEVEVAVNGTLHSFSVIAGQVYDFNAQSISNSVGVITSNVPIFVARNNHLNLDTYAVPPTATVLYGIKSTTVRMSASEDATSIHVYASDGTSATYQADKGQLIQVTTGTSGSNGNGSALRLVADKPIAAIQFGDGDGGEATAFWPESAFSRQYVMPINGQYAAIVCAPRKPANIDFISVEGEVVGNLQCTPPDDNSPGSVRLYSSQNLTAGTRIVSDVPVMVTFDDASFNSERNIRGSNLIDLVEVDFPGREEERNAVSSESLLVSIAPIEGLEGQIARVQVRLNGGEWVDAQFENGQYFYDFGSQMAGEHLIEVQVIDNIGQQHNSSFIVNYEDSIAGTLDQLRPAPYSPLAAPEQDLVGEIKGNAQVDGGAFNYSIPLSLPPGINGMRPSVSLSYSSQSGLGVAGYGWSLGAGSSISRCASMHVLDGHTKNVLRSAEDAICLDGQRLVERDEPDEGNLSGEPGALVVYQPERNPNVRVSLMGSGALGNSSYFLVRHKDGRLDTYDVTFVPIDTTSLAGFSSNPISWNISQSEDLNGNNIQYVYDSDLSASNNGSEVTGYLLLTDIFYTGRDGAQGNRQVEFEYDDHTTSVDIEDRTYYSYSYKTASQHRLSRVNIKIAGTQTDYYELGHGSENALDAIHHCFGAGATSSECLSIDFDYYQAQGDAFATTTNDTPYKAVDATDDSLYYATYTPLADYDGDGFNELMYVESVSEVETVTKIKMSRTGTVKLMSDYLGLTKTQFEALQGGCTEEVSGSCPSENTTFSNHFEGDMDYDFDGRTDLVFVNEVGNVAVASKEGTVITDLGIDASCEVELGQVRFGSSSCRSYITDLNHDGFQDLLVATGTHDNHKLSVYLRGDNGFTHAGDTPGGLQAFQMVDLDGDGQVDLVDTTWHVWKRLSFTGGTLFMEDLDLPFKDDIELGAAKRQSHTIMSDFNGDGLPDFMLLHEPAGSADFGSKLSWYMAINKGRGEFENLVDTGMDENLSHGNADYFLMGEASMAGLVKPLDYNGDGRTDLLVPHQARFKYQCKKRNPATGVYEDCVNEDADNFPRHHHRHDIWYWKVWQTQEDGHSFEEVLLGADGKDVYGKLTLTSLVDVNYDGQLDIVSTIGTEEASWIYEYEDVLPSGNYVFYRHQDEYKAGLLQSVTTEFAEALQLDYQPLKPGAGFTHNYLELTDDHNYYVDNSENDDKHYVNFGSSMVVVEELRSDNGVGGMNALRYKYKNARFHLQGRGFQGFEQIIVDDVSRNTREISTYSQEFPYTGWITQKDTIWLGDTPDEDDDILIGRYLNNEELFSHTFSCVVGEEEESQVFDIKDGVDPYRVNRDDPFSTNYMSKTVTTRQYDQFCNITGQTTINSDYRTELQKWMGQTQTVTSEFVGVSGVNGGFRKVHDVVSSHATYDDASWALPESGEVVRTTRYNYSKSTDHLPNYVLVSNGDNSETNTSPSQLVNAGIYHLRTALTYDEFGNNKRTTYNGTGLDGTRWVQVIYTSDGYFPYRTQNSQWGSWNNATRIDQYNLRYGLPEISVDVNGVTTTVEYNLLGLPVRSEITAEDGALQPAPPVFTSYHWCDTCSEATHARYRIETVQLGTPNSTVYFDTLGRDIRTQIQTFNDQADEYGTKTYNALGYMTAERSPGGGTTTYAGFDVLGRPGSKTVSAFPQNFTSTYSYDGFDTSIDVTASGAATLSMSRTYNGRNQLIKTVDANNNDAYFAYDGAGNPTLMRDVNGNDIVATYNGMGFKTLVNDPNQGETEFTYNGLGELLSQTDANDVTTYLEYDKMGRVWRKAQGTDVSIWNYDLVIKGTLTAETRGTNRLDYTYDVFSRPLTQLTTIDGQTYEHAFEYDPNYGRVMGESKPDGRIVAYEYDELGYKRADFRPDQIGLAHTLYASFDDYERTGQLKSLTFGNGLTQSFEYFDASGQMNGICIGSSGNCFNNASVQYINYGYDSYGNVTNVDDVPGGLSKTYLYDNLHRLDAASITVGSHAALAIDYEYDAAGNLMLKSDYASSYSYGNSTKTGGGNAGPNAVRQITKADGSGTVDYHYDNAGNLSSDSDGLAITYDGNNHTKSVTRNGSTLTFYYDASGARYKQVNVSSTKTVTTLYVGDFEVISDATSTVEKTYIGAHTILSNVTVGVDPTPSISYIGRDRLGSVSVVLDGDRHLDDVPSGDSLVLQRRDYDAFGKTIDLTTGLLPDSFVTTERGFTDHEHLQDVELIHMNGRAFDYNLGRFLSVDPFIQFVTNSQSVNPYSYLMNNPMSGTDPSGYCQAEVGSHLKKCVKVEVTDTDTGQTTTKSMNSLHSKFNENVVTFAKRVLGNGAKITGITAHMKGGNKIDLVGKPVNIVDPKQPGVKPIDGNDIDNVNVDGEMHVSQQMVNSLKDWEKDPITGTFASSPYKVLDKQGNPSGNWTVGYGHEITDAEYNSGKFNNINQNEALMLLRKDIEIAESRVKQFIVNNNSNFKPTQNQFDALVHLTFNTGYLGAIYHGGPKSGNLKFPKLVRNFQQGNYRGMIDEIRDITNGGLTGLVSRRMHERNMFLNGVYSGRP